MIAVNPSKAGSSKPLREGVKNTNYLLQTGSLTGGGQPAGRKIEKEKTEKYARVSVKNLDIFPDIFINNERFSLEPKFFFFHKKHTS